MIKGISINLCDYEGILQSEELLHKFYTVNSELRKKELLMDADEVWIGSEVCENLFLSRSANEYQQIVNLFYSRKIGVCLVVPRIHEENFERVIELIKKIENLKRIIASDIGTVTTIHKELPLVDIVFGRTYEKSPREVRLKPEQIDSRYAVEEMMAHQGLFDSNHLSFLKLIGVIGVTEDSVPYSFLSIPYTDIEVYFQYPRIFLSQAARCEFCNSENRNPLLGCDFGCLAYHKMYKRDGYDIIKKGRMVFTEEKRPLAECIDGNVRVVYTI